MKTLRIVGFYVGTAIFGASFGRGVAMTTGCAHKYIDSSVYFPAIIGLVLMAICFGGIKCISLKKKKE